MSQMNAPGTMVELSADEASSVVGGGYFQSFYEFYFSGTLNLDGTVAPRMGATLPSVQSQTTNVGDCIRRTNSLLRG